MFWAFACIFVFSTDSISESEISLPLLSIWQWIVLGILASLVILWAVLSFVIARYSVVRRCRPYTEKVV